ncbi:MAG: type II toxin-antitoxin system HicA family toxin [Fimbriimonadaceae bacterium]
MDRFPVDAPRAQVLSALNQLGFEIVREKERISLVRSNEDGTRTPMTIPNHKSLNGSTLRNACGQAGISRDAFLEAFRTS